MKRIGWIRLGVTYAGFFLGAGYLSGQEIWKFFGRFGIRGLPGLLLAMLLFFLFGSLIIRLAQKTGILEMDRAIVPQNLPWVHALVGFLQAFFLFSVYVVTSAGSGALARQAFGVPTMLGSGIFCLVVAAVTILGLSGMVTAFSYAVPVLIAAALPICFKIVIPFDAQAFSAYCANNTATNWGWPPARSSPAICSAPFRCSARCRR